MHRNSREETIVWKWTGTAGKNQWYNMYSYSRGETMQHKNNIQVNTPRVMFAATRSGSGKTTVTCGVLAALKNRI